jgi:hypothetical protein
MRNLAAILALVVVLYAPFCVQASDPWADAVVSITYGPGAGFGQSHFPDNVLGPPDSSASQRIPSQSPKQLLALGSGGEIVLRFDEPGITDGPGTDFTVFENVFVYGDGTTEFQETAFVAVSSDGQTWYEFSWDSGTFAGLAGVDPTHGNADPTDPTVSGGDSFDIAQLALETIYFVRLTDTNDTVHDDGPSFDLDAVVAIHDPNYEPESETTLPVITEIHAWPNPFNSTITISTPVDTKKLHVYDTLGRTIATLTAQRGRVVWNTAQISSGVFLIKADDNSQPLRVVKVQ